MNENIQISQSVLIIDDHILFREGLVSLFNSTHDFHVVDKGGTVREGVEKALDFRPDIILMDYWLPDGTGLDATRAILDKLPESRIIFLVVHEADESLMEAIRLGARGYLLKNVSSSSMLASLRLLAKDELAASRSPGIL